MKFKYFITDVEIISPFIIFVEDESCVYFKDEIYSPHLYDLFLEAEVSSISINNSKFIQINVESLGD